MKRKLLRQIANEWSSNVWLILELLIVSTVLWFIADKMYTTISILNEPNGFDTEHCYQIDCGMLSEKSPDYNPDLTNDFSQNANELLERIRRRPDVEAVGMGQNAHPYNGSNSGIGLEIDSLFPHGYVVRRFITPDFLRVFRYRGSHGETPEELIAQWNKNHNGIFISDNLFNNYGYQNMDKFIGRKFSADCSPDSVTMIGALQPVKYDDYTPRQRSKTAVIILEPEQYDQMNELVVRVKENMDKDFALNFMKDAAKEYRIGNLYVSAVRSFDSIRSNFQRRDTNEIRNLIAGVVFLCVNIFLALLGTFWFRTQLRTSEIALRKASGATNANIFRRMIGEGMLLLTVATIPAIGLDYLLIYSELNSYYGPGFFEPVRFFASIAIAYGIMALMIVLGIAIPAYKAMHIEIAPALNEE